MAELKVAICDDEPLANRRLRRLLAECGGVDVVVEETSGDEAARRIVELTPDIVFLDIEMPSPDGFEIVDLICHPQREAERVPFVVFVTAHDEFAPQAFDAGAIDFLPKPVRRSRLEVCLARARNAVAARSAADQLATLQRSFDLLRRQRPTAPQDSEHMWIPRRGELVRLDMDDVTMIRAEAEYVRLFTRSASYLHRCAISAVEASLDPELFTRIHRSMIVRRTEVVAIRRSLHGGTVVRLSIGEEYPVGRKYAKSARATLARQPS